MAARPIGSALQAPSLLLNSGDQVRPPTEEDLQQPHLPQSDIIDKEVAENFALRETSQKTGQVTRMILLDEESSGSSPRESKSSLGEEKKEILLPPPAPSSQPSPLLSTLSPALSIEDPNVANKAVPAPKAKPKANPKDATLTPEDVPRSKDLYQINTITTCLEQFREEELKYLIMIACIDGEMRETITLNWSSSNVLIEVIDDLLAKPANERNFSDAQTLFHTKLAELKEEELRLYKSLLGARSHIFIKGVETEITRQLKEKLLADFGRVIDARFKITFNEFTPQSLENLVELKRQLEQRNEEMLLLKDDMLESKVALHMKSEDLKVTSEYKALIAARKQLRSLILSASMWEAADRGDTAMLTTELEKASMFARLLPDDRRFVNQRNPLGYTALHIASYKGDPACVTLLLGANASRKIRDQNGYQALHWAAAEGHLAVCRLLLQRDKKYLDAKATVLNDKGEEVGVFRDLEGKERGGYGRTALHRASYRGHHPVVKFLLDEGADPNVKTAPENGSVTPLHEATAKAHNLVISELLKSPKINVEVTDERGHSPLWWAVVSGRTDYIVLLTGHPSYKRAKDPKDPNHIDNLLRLQPPINQEKMKTLLEDLKIVSKDVGK